MPSLIFVPIDSRMFRRPWTFRRWGLCRESSDDGHVVYVNENLEILPGGNYGKKKLGAQEKN